MRLWISGPRLFGIPTGLILGPEDFRRRNQTRAASSDNSNFIYVAANDAGLVKIGITGNPDARLSQLRYASESPVRYAWIAAPQGAAFAIEQDALRALAEYKHSGEWLTASAELAIGAINTAALRRDQNLLVVTLPMARRIVNSIAARQRAKPSALYIIAQVLLGIVLGVALFGFIVFRISRILF
jgi:hypothetical protein